MEIPDLKTGELHSSFCHRTQSLTGQEIAGSLLGMSGHAYSPKSGRDPKDGCPLDLITILRQNGERNLHSAKSVSAATGAKLTFRKLRHRLEPIAHVQLFANALHVRLNGFHADSHPVRNLLVNIAACQKI